LLEKPLKGFGFSGIAKPLNGFGFSGILSSIGLT
jgi:hypothetical protein